MNVINTAKFESARDLTNEMLETAARDETVCVLIDDRLFVLTPAELARDKMAEAIAKRLAENPSLLHDLQCRLESEEPEDWD